jgi:beta-galactosidase
VLWNVESHVNGGQTTMHQGQRTLTDLLHDWVPQIGAGVTGFLFWQFRAEVLGLEAPAWGVVRPDGSDRPVTKAAADFRRLLGDHAQALTRCTPQRATVGIWHSQENELFSWSVHGSLDHFNAGQQAWLDLAWTRNLPVAFVPTCAALGGTGLESLRVLVMPSPYLLGQAEADALAAWVEAGGVLLTEAHLGAYDRDRGRHSTTVPGLGLAARFAIRESESMSTWHLPVERSAAFANATDDVKKMLAGGAAGGKHVPLRLAGGTIAWGALRYTELAAPQAEVLGRFAETPSIVASRVGNGLVIYAGTDLGAAAGQGRAGMEALFDRALAAAGLEATVKASGARVSLLHEDGALRYVTVVNPDNATREFSADLPALQGVFTGECWESGATRTLPPRFAELFAVTNRGA